MEKKYKISIVILFLISQLLFIAIDSFAVNIDNDPLSINETNKSCLNFPGGNGTISNPYQVSNISQLQNLRSNLSAHYIILNDIDASNTQNWNSGSGFIPIGQGSNRFQGTLEGNGYNIINLFINWTFNWEIGLFGRTSSHCKIENVSLKDITCNGGARNIGGLVGVNYGFLTNCSIEGNINGSRYSVGGLVGTNLGVVNRSHTDVNVSGQREIGGLIGYNFGNVNMCSSKGVINGTNINIGGLIGYNAGSLINGCYADVNVSGHDYTGGLIGTNECNLSNCGVSGNVSGLDDYVGGLVGINLDGFIENCYVFGSVSGRDNNVGGLVGQNDDIIKNSSTNVTVIGDSHVGGFAGVNTGTVLNCTSTVDISGRIIIGGLAGENTGIIKNCSSEGFAGGKDAIGGLIGWEHGGSVIDCVSFCNVTGENEIGGLIGRIWTSVNNSYYCINETSINNDHNMTHFGLFKEQFNDWLSGGKSINIDNYLSRIPGTDEYNISNIYDLKNILPFADSGGYSFLQTNDINLSSDPNFFIPVFRSGSYNGGSHIINELNISINNSYAGFIGLLMDGARIQNISIQDYNIKGIDYLGGLAGMNAGNIEFIHTQGRITGDDIIGGISGFNRGNIKQCIAEANISGEDDYIGGIAGNSKGTVDNCRSFGQIRGDEYIGGICGSNQGNIENCSTNGRSIGRYGIGGIIGNNGGNIQFCFSSGNSSGKNSVGGLVGVNNNNVKNSYSNTSVFSNWGSGGLVGENRGYINGSYSFGNVVGTLAVGGLIGNNLDSVESSFWDIQTSGQVTSDGGNGRTTTQMKNKTTFTSVGWDFHNVWDIFDGSTYPFFSNQIYSLSRIITPDRNITFEDEQYLVNYSIDLKNCTLPGVSNPLWKLRTNVTWLSMNNTGALQGIPLNGDVGTCFVNVSVLFSNNELIDYSNFTLHVINKNDAPRIIFQHLPNAIEEKLYDQTISIQDEDLDINVGEIISFYLDEKPDGMMIDERTGNLNWIPTNEQAHQHHMIKVNISDSGGLWDTAEFDIFVTNINDHPIIISTPPIIAIEEMEYQYNVTAIDEDLENPSVDFLIYSLDRSPGGMSMDPLEGTISWIPTNEQANNGYSIIINISDRYGAWALQEFEIFVENTNDIPIIISSPILEAKEDVEYNYQIIAVDDDLLNSVEELLVYKFDKSPSSMSINEIDGIIKWIPTNDDVHIEHQVIVNVTDQYGEFALQEYMIHVSNTNDPPEIIELLNDVQMIEDSINWDISLIDVFYDADGDLLEYKISNSDNLSIDIFPNGSVRIRPKMNWSGKEPIKIFANDSRSEVFQIINITVLPINDQPVNNNFTYRIWITNRNNVSFTAHPAIDADNDILTYSWDFGDGKTGSGIKINHSYSRSNVSKYYQVTLMIFDCTSRSEICIQRVLIDAVPDEIPHIDDDDDTAPDDDITVDDDFDGNTNEFPILIIIIIFTVVLIIVSGSVFLLMSLKKISGKEQITPEDDQNQYSDPIDPVKILNEK